MVNLGWKLAMVLREKAAPALLGTYAEERLQAIDQLERGLKCRRSSARCAARYRIRRLIRVPAGLAATWPVR